MYTLLYTNYHSILSIDITLQSYLTSTQIDDSYYNKHEIDTTLTLYTPTAQILNNFYRKLYIDNLFLISAQTGALYYTKTDTDTLLADTVSNTGNVSLPCHLDIGTTYTSSGIRCNAEVNCYTGYAELKAASSYDMFINLSTRRVNGGWVYHKINNDNYLLLSGSGQFVKHFKPLVASSDDILKENKVIIESACETLSKLRPQLYGKQTNMEHTDSTTWIKESVLIAQ